MQDHWRQTLRQYRIRRDLTQVSLGTRAGGSEGAGRAYENGLRRPGRATLDGLIGALGIPLEDANAIRTAAGYPARGVDRSVLIESDVTAEAAAYPWPVFVLNQSFEIVAANEPLRSLWRVNVSPSSDGRPVSLFGLLSASEVAPHIANWDEFAALVVGIWRRGDRSLENPPIHLVEGVESFVMGDPQYLARLLRVWERALPLPTQPRLHCDVYWTRAMGSDLHFFAAMTMLDSENEWSWHDWIPADAVTWRALV